MFDHTHLRETTWICTNARVGCDVVLPCFDASARVQRLLLVTSQWGGLMAPAGRLTRRDTHTLDFAGPLEDLFKLSAQAANQLAGIYLFDPNWLASHAPIDPPLVEVIRRVNLAGALFGKLPVTGAYYDDALTVLDHLDVGSALWRRPVGGTALGQWLASSPTIQSAGGMQSLLGVHEPKRADRDALYAQDHPGPLRVIATDHRVATARVTIGRPGAGATLNVRAAQAHAPGTPARGPIAPEGPTLMARPAAQDTPPTQVIAAQVPTIAAEPRRERSADPDLPVAKAIDVPAEAAPSEPVLPRPADTQAYPLHTGPQRPPQRPRVPADPVAEAIDKIRRRINRNR